MEYKTDAVLDIQGNAVFNASIRALTKSRQLAAVYNASGVQIPNPVSTDKTGEYSLALPNGEYYLEVSFNGTVYETKGPVTFFDPKDAGIISVKDFKDIEAAVLESPGKSIIVSSVGDDTALPDDYSQVLIEYRATHPARLTHSASIQGLAKRTLKTQFPSAHQDSIVSAFHIEAQAKGSGKNGPNSADKGLTIAVHKQGYAGSTDPVGGEMDGLSIFVRQDGPKGQASGSATSSDASGILVNIQNVDDVGFTSAWEASTSNYNRGAGAISRSIQTQIGVLDMNRAGVPTYGFVAISTVGQNGHAFYAGKGSAGGTWDNIIFAPGSVRIDGVGNYYAPTTEWVNGAWTIVRAAGANSSTQMTHRGTGALLLMAQESAIQFGAGGGIRWEMTTTGGLRPSSTNTNGDFGDPNRRVTPYAQKIDISPAGVSGQIITGGAGSPEGAVAGRVGSLYLRSDGGAGTTLYIKESGTGNTGWVAK